LCTPERDGSPDATGHPNAALDALQRDPTARLPRAFEPDVIRASDFGEFVRGERSFKRPVAMASSALIPPGILATP